MVTKTDHVEKIMPNDPRVIPGWFLKTVCAFMAGITVTAIPWAWALQQDVQEITIRMEVVPELKTKVARLIDQTTGHTIKIDELTRRLTALETKSH